MRSRSDAAVVCPAGRSSLPVFELLELRAMLTAVNVTDLADDGSSGSLRSAINAASAGETITLSAGTYTLTQNELSIADINGALTITGNGSSGPNATIIDQLSVDRVFQIAAGASVTFKNLEITGGVAVNGDPAVSAAETDGGGILSDGNLTLNNVVVTGNKAVTDAQNENADGGGIYATGILTIGGGSVIENNSAVAAGGSNGNGPAYAFGGGVFSNSAGQVTIDDSTIADNIAVGGTAAGGGFAAIGGGAYISNSGTSASLLNDDTITGNQSVGGNGENSGDAGGNADGGRTLCRHRGCRQRLLRSAGHDHQYHSGL